MITETFEFECSREKTKAVHNEKHGKLGIQKLSNPKSFILVKIYPTTSFQKNSTSHRFQEDHI